MQLFENTEACSGVRRQVQNPDLLPSSQPPAATLRHLVGQTDLAG
jgi:hypothetical protein